jgi:Tfp pilus assembly major pilin PilA
VNSSAWSDTQAGRGKTSKRTSKSGGAKVPLEGLKCGSASHASYSRKVKDGNGNVGEGTYIYNVPSPDVVNISPTTVQVSRLQWHIEYIQVITLDSQQVVVNPANTVKGRQRGMLVESIPIWEYCVKAEFAYIPHNGKELVPVSRYTRDASGHGTYILSGRVPYAGTDRNDARQSLAKLSNPTYFSAEGKLLANWRLDLSAGRAAIVMRRKVRKSAYRKTIARKIAEAKQQKAERIATDERRRLYNIAKQTAKFRLSAADSRA